MNKIIKKIVPALAALVAMVAISTSAMAANFPDLPEDPVMRQALINAADNGLFQGDDTGEIRPYGNITRAEMGAIITRCLGAKAVTDISKYSDADPTQWYYESLSRAVTMGAFKGDDTGRLNPQNNITFQETFAVVQRIFDIQDKNAAVIDTISDKAAIDEWAMPYVEAVYAGGYWKESTLRPNDYITRGEFAILMNNLVQTYIDEAGAYDALPDGNVVVRSGNVSFDYITNTHKIFIGDGVEGNVTFTNSDLNILVGRGGVVIPDNTKVYKIRLTQSGAEATIVTTQVKDNKAEPYWGVKGTIFNMGAIHM